MNPLALVFLVVINFGIAFGQEFGGMAEAQLSICVDPGQLKPGELNQVGYAKQQASQIFAAVRVSIEWRMNRACSTSPDAVEMTFRAETPQELRPGALAYAFPFVRSQIFILYDRVAAVAANREVAPNRLLAFVIVHEVTHVLQGVDRHSASGIMKAKWTGAEFFQIRRASLGFTELDADLIHAKKNTSRVSQQLASTAVVSKAAEIYGSSK